MQSIPYTLKKEIVIKKTKLFSVLDLSEVKSYEVNINFDAAQDAWEANKIKGKNGTYRYKIIEPPILTDEELTSQYALAEELGIL